MDPFRKYRKIDNELEEYNSDYYSNEYDSDGSLPIPMHEQISIESSDDDDFEDDMISQPSQEPTDSLSCLPSKAQEIVMNSLSGNDLKSLSLVSKFWYHKTAQSEAMSAKLRLKIDFIEGTPKEEHLLAILRSRRSFSDCQVLIKNISSVSKKTDLIIKKLAPSMTHLNIEKIGGINTLINKPYLFFRLQSLELHVSCGSLSCDFGYVQSLKRLSVDGLEPKAFAYCLVQNPALQELILYENSFISYFEEDITLFSSFQLQKLAIFDHLAQPNAFPNEFPAEKWETRTRINFMKFLRSQSNSLTTLRLGKCNAQDLNRIIVLLPHLRCLQIDQMSGNFSKLDFMKNNSIETFIADFVQDEFIQFVANSFHNLKRIFIGKVNTHHFFFAVVVAKKLQKFCYFWASADEQGKFIDLKEHFSKTSKKYRGANRRSLEITKMTKEKFISQI